MWILAWRLYKTTYGHSMLYHIVVGLAPEPPAAAEQPQPHPAVPGSSWPAQQPQQSEPATRPMAQRSSELPEPPGGSAAQREPPEQQQPVESLGKVHAGPLECLRNLPATDV